MRTPGRWWHVFYLWMYSTRHVLKLHNYMILTRVFLQQHSAWEHRADGGMYSTLNIQHKTCTYTTQLYDFNSCFLAAVLGMRTQSRWWHTWTSTQSSWRSVALMTWWTTGTWLSWQPGTLQTVEWLIHRRSTHLKKRSVHSLNTPLKEIFAWSTIPLWHRWICWVIH